MAEDIEETEEEHAVLHVMFNSLLCLTIPLLYIQFFIYCKNIQETSTISSFASKSKIYR